MVIFSCISLCVGQRQQEIVGVPGAKLQPRWWKRNHESWIVNHSSKHVRIMNLCFKNSGIMNLCTSARESWITRLWEKLNKIHLWINCVRSRECRMWRFRESNFQFFYIIRAFGANSSLVSPMTLCLIFSHKKLHAKTKRMMIPSLNEAELWTPKPYKTRLSCPWENH